MATQVLDSDGHPEWLSRAAFPFDSRYIDIDRKRIHYIDEGSGPALILISAGMWSFMFRDVVLRLRDQFRCVTLDFPGSGLSPVSPHHDGSVQANAEILEGFINSLDLQDITMVVHDVGGPIGFQVATRLPRRFRALVATNTFGWPIRNYAMARRMLDFVGSPLFGVLNTYTNILARYTASSAGVGKLLSMADRKAFLGPWRARAVRRASQRAIAGAGRIDPLMAEIEQLLKTELGDLPVLTLFGRKNDPFDWQDRFARTFKNVTAAGIEEGHHFPFCDDPDAYSETIKTWWADHVANPNSAGEIA